MISNNVWGFVSVSDMIPDVILEIRYYSIFNFVGERIDGYEQPAALLTAEAASALKRASDDARARGYPLVPQAPDGLGDSSDVRMKRYFYPGIDKDTLIPGGYIAERSGHSRGSTVDLTLYDMRTQKELDMGSPFDFFGEVSHPDYRGITEQQYANRMLLRDIMVSNGFLPLDEEWWHFTLAGEPWPDTYFTFPVRC